MRIPNPDEPPIEVPFEVMFSTTNVEDDADEIVRRFLKTNSLPNPWLRPRNDREQLQIDDEGELAKSMTSSARRRAGILRFLQSQIALGKSVEELVNYAAQHDSETALLMREVAIEAALT